MLITSGITTYWPFATVLAWVLVRGMSDREKYLATSSSYPHILSKNPIYWCLVKISTTG